ncbi:MAG: glutathione S-transferase family protein [Wenzhouxiangellaceae bacterium]
MKLYWYWSFNPQKIRLALECLKLPYTLIEVDLGGGQQRDSAFLQLNPNGKVPVLEAHGHSWWESNAILTYLGEYQGQMWPDDAVGRAEVARWLYFEARHLSEPIGQLWFNRYVLPLMQRQMTAESQQRLQRAEFELPALLRVLEQHLQGRPWMYGQRLSLLDCCYGPLLDALQLSRFKLDDYPNLNRYLRAMRALPAWHACDFRR